MKTDMPVLRNHDTTAVIGVAAIVDGRVLVEFRPEARITIDQVLNAFGSCREVESIEVDGAHVVLKAEVFYFNVEA